MAISTYLNSLISTRDSIRTKLLDLDILVNSSAKLSQCYDALSVVVSLSTSTYTPTSTSQTIPSMRYLTGDQVIEAIPSAYVIPSGTLSISANGTYNAASYASVAVAVSGGGGIVPTGTLSISIGEVTILSTMGTYFASSSGVYDVASYASVNIDLLAELSDMTVPMGTYTIGSMSKGTYTISNYYSAKVEEDFVSYYKACFLGQDDTNGILVIHSSSFPSAYWESAYNTASTWSTAIGMASGLFAGRWFDGDFTFSNVTRLKTYTFGGFAALSNSNYTANLSFPNMRFLDGLAASAFRYRNQYFTVYMSGENFKSAMGCSYVFANCSMTSVHFGATLKSMSTNSAFNSSFSLVTVRYDGLNLLSGASFFYNCSRFSSLFLLGSSVCALGTTAATTFRSTPFLSTNISYNNSEYGRIFVPSSLLASYKTATNWTTISSRFFAYETYFNADGTPK